MKVGLVATVNDQGLPHVSLLASLQASAPTQLVFGQFTEGLSKQHIQTNPRVGFLIMTMDKAWWRGLASFSHTAQHGTEFDMYNNQPMFRYNSYFGVHTVYYLDLVEHSGRQLLPMGSVVFGAIKTIVARTLSRKTTGDQVLNGWTQQLFNKLDNLKFLAYVGHLGHPVIIPVIQAQAAGNAELIFAISPYRRELEAIPAGIQVALFGMALTMEDVLVRGTYHGIARVGGMQCGRVEANWVYNPMPPKPQQIYPDVGIEPVTVF